MKPSVSNLAGGKPLGSSARAFKSVTSYSRSLQMNMKPQRTSHFSGISFLAAPPPPAPPFGCHVHLCRALCFSLPWVRRSADPGLRAAAQRAMTQPGGYMAQRLATASDTDADGIPSEVFFLGSTEAPCSATLICLGPLEQKNK